MNLQPNATVATDGLNLRRGPSTDDEVAGVLTRGARIAIDGVRGAWRSVDTPLGRGFVHGDFLQLDPGFTLPPEEAPPPERVHTVVSGETLGAIAGLYGLDWRLLAAANALANPDVLQIGQLLRIPGAGGSSGVTVMAPILAGLLTVGDPLSMDGSAVVTSSSATGHHTPYGGSHSADLDVTGRSQGAEVRFNIDCPGMELRGVVARIGFACRSQRAEDGGYSLMINVEARRGGDWAPLDTWVLYAHLDPVFSAEGTLVEPGQVVGRLGPPSGPEYRSSCATASHVHVEATRGSFVAATGGPCGGEPLFTLSI